MAVSFLSDFQLDWLIIIFLEGSGEFSGRWVGGETAGGGAEEEHAWLSRSSANLIASEAAVCWR